MLAQLDCRLPVGHHWRYEPKLDGFRGLLWRRGNARAQLLSRNARDLSPWFPEIVAAAQKLPPGTLLDGEIVMCDEAGCVDFGGLQERLSTARFPAVFVRWRSDRAADECGLDQLLA